MCTQRNLFTHLHRAKTYGHTGGALKPAGSVLHGGPMPPSGPIPPHLQPQQLALPPHLIPPPPNLTGVSDLPLLWSSHIHTLTHKHLHKDTHTYLKTHAYNSQSSHKLHACTCKAKHESSATLQIQTPPPPPPPMDNSHALYEDLFMPPGFSSTPQVKGHACLPCACVWVSVCLTCFAVRGLLP
jgi:hypothetical protein